MLIVSQFHHELLIAKCKDQIRRLPEGCFGFYRDKKVVYITRDPADPEVTPKRRKRYNIDSKNGMIYTPLIKKSNLLKSRLKQLTDLWNDTYWKVPHDIRFPLYKKHNSILTPERYFNSPEMQNPILSKVPVIDYNGRQLRSKNELIACKSFDQWGYEYKIEIDLSPDEFTGLYPDVTFYASEIEKPISIEIDGAMDKDSYQRKSEQRIGDYLRSGFEEYKDVVFLRLNSASDFYDDIFKNLITAAILCNLEDIVI